MRPRDPNKMRVIYIRMLFVSCIILLILLGLFQSIWVLSGSGTSIMNQVGLQRVRVQAITKDVLILAYRPVDEHVQSVSELQNVLPMWEKVQLGLQQGDKSLQLPAHPPDEVLQALALARSDYTAIDTAARVILANADKPVDPIQMTIIVSHEHGYAVAMSQVANAWQSHIDDAFIQIFYWESGIVLVLIVLLILMAILHRKQIKSLLNYKEQSSCI